MSGTDRAAVAQQPAGEPGEAAASAAGGPQPGSQQRRGPSDPESVQHAHRRPRHQPLSPHPSLFTALSPPIQRGDPAAGVVFSHINKKIALI